MTVGVDIAMSRYHKQQTKGSPSQYIVRRSRPNLGALEHFRLVSFLSVILLDLDISNRISVPLEFW